MTSETRDSMRPAVERPGKIICVGLNYRDHASESGLDLPQTPLLFAKWPSSVIGAGDAIKLPSITDEVDYEAELGVVIGKIARNVSEAEALDCVAGITCLNDVSARDIQRADGQWTRAKSLDTFCPIGPRLAPLDEVGDLDELRIRCILNDQVMQDSTTAELIFKIPQLISYITTGITLEPGDVIATGTPSGVGFARTPPVFLRDGDTVTVEVEGVGRLTNPVTAAA